MKERINPEVENRVKPTFIGVAWPYVNGELHIGHLAGYLLPADICARFHRYIGEDVLMVSGSDCHGTPITVEADRKGTTPQEIADFYHEIDVHLLKNVLGLSYDIYTRTDTEHHKKIVQDFFMALLEKGYLFAGSQEQYYSPEENRFLPDRYVEGTCKHCGFVEARGDQCDNCGQLLDKGMLDNPRGKLSGKPVIFKETQHYFVDWPKLQPEIEKYVEEGGPRWKKWVFRETNGWLKRGLQPRAITRDLDWGVPLPIDRIPENMRIRDIEQKRIYVWFDAVIGYFSASLLWSKESGGDWKSFWYNPDAKHYYFMGKDNLVFHTIFWPGQLMVYDSKLHLPDFPSINMFLDLAGQKFSKSRGVSIEINEMINKFGNDRVRFYLTYIMPEITDSSFRWEDFQDIVNGVLIGNLGNYIHRILSIGRNVDMKLVSEQEVSALVFEKIKNAFKKSRSCLENCEFRNYLDNILDLSGFGNKYFDRNNVWKLKRDDDPRYHRSLKNLYYIIISLGHLMYPLLPDASDRLFDMIKVKRLSRWPKTESEFKKLEALVRDIDPSIKPRPLFKKIEKNDY